MALGLWTILGSAVLYIVWKNFSFIAAIGNALFLLMRESFDKDRGSGG